MKMIQTDTTYGRPTYEIFYDGQLPVEYDGTYGVVTIPRRKIHWSNELLLRGYEFVNEDAVEEEAPSVVEETRSEEAPKRASTARKKAKNG